MEHAQLDRDQPAAQGVAAAAAPTCVAGARRRDGHRHGHHEPASSASGSRGGGGRSGGLPPEITPNRRFYTVSKDFLSDPSVDAGPWRLDVHGLVGQRLALSLDDLEAIPAVEQYATLACISNEVPGRAIGNALWKGVRLRDVLEQAGGVRPGAVDAVFVCADNYTDSITVAKALEPTTILAYEMNGERLPRLHGSPLRAIVPGIYGMKNAKWIETIEIVDHDYRGYWMRRGWSDVATYQTMSRIDVPRPRARLAGEGPHGVGGIAFAGDRGISKVEVSADEGESWTEATVRPPLGSFTWVLWGLEWRPAERRTYTLTVRATDGTGKTQTSEQRDPAPDGATGWHSIQVMVA